MADQDSAVATVSWPVTSGHVPPLAACYCPRPQTGLQPRPALPSGESWLAGAAEAGDDEAGEASCYVLAGPGGTGKTQLAAAHAGALWQSRDIELLIWITASSRAAIITGYAQALAQTSGAPGGPPPGARYGSGTEQEETAFQFLRWLGESTRSWLVVLDDVADVADLSGLWPRGAMGRSVLTTRLPPATAVILGTTLQPGTAVQPGTGVRLVPAGPFSRREALSFLRARLPEDNALHSGALDLAETVGCLPIALAQASDLIANSRIDCREYQDRFGERQRAMGISPGSGPAATVAVTWSLALDRADELLPAALARPVLALLAMLDPNGAPAEVLTSPAARQFIGSYGPNREPVTDQQVHDVLRGLAQAGLVVVDPRSTVRTVYTHALVQACVRQVLPDAVRDQSAAAAASAVLQAWPDPDPDPLLDQALRDCAATLSRAGGPALRSPAEHPVLLRTGRSLDAARLGGPATAYWRALTQADTRAPGQGNGHTVAAAHGPSRELC
jgi:hypothetical protein